jgi:hypothetical protein
MGRRIELHIIAPLGFNRQKIIALMSMLLTRYDEFGDPMVLSYVCEEVGIVTATVHGVPKNAHKRIKDGLFFAFDKRVEINLTVVATETPLEAAPEHPLLH